MTAAFSVAPASERTLDAADYLLGCLALALIVGGFAFAAWQVQGGGPRGLVGGAGAGGRGGRGDRAADRGRGAARDVCGLRGVDDDPRRGGGRGRRELGTWEVGGSGRACSGSAGAARPRGSPCGWRRWRSPWSRPRGWCRRSARSPAAWTAPTALWYHMPLGDPVRRRRPLRLDRLLRPDLLRLLLPGELRGLPRGPDPRLRPRHRLAAAQPRRGSRSASPPPTRSAAPTALGPQS